MLSAILALSLAAAPAAQEPTPAAAPPPPPAEAELNAALEIARRKNQRVLLVWGGDW